MSVMHSQKHLFSAMECPPHVRDGTSSTFGDNMRLPVHRWFRFSAGFSAEWAEHVIRSSKTSSEVTVLDPFAGSGTTLLAAENADARSYGIEAHPFMYRIAHAKLARRSDAGAYARLVSAILEDAKGRSPDDLSSYPKLIHECYSSESLGELDMLRQAVEAAQDDSPTSELAWLALAGILRTASHANTAQWQYILPKKSKKNPARPFAAFEALSRHIHEDMVFSRQVHGPSSSLLLGDARTCDGIPDASIQLVVCSPPYPNNYDYADATRLEMSFFREISGWGGSSMHRSGAFNPFLFAARAREGR